VSHTRAPAAFTSGATLFFCYFFGCFFLPLGLGGALGCRAVPNAGFARPRAAADCRRSATRHPTMGACRCDSDGARHTLRACLERVFFCAKTSFRIDETRFRLLLRCWEHAALQVASSPLAFVNHAPGYQTIIQAHARAPLRRAGFFGPTLALDCTKPPTFETLDASRFVVRYFV